MANRHPLGDGFNLATSATVSKVRVNLQNAAGVTFVLIGATTGAATINECNAATGGTEQLVGGGGSGIALVYYTQNNGVWTKATGSASTVTAATGGLLAVYVSSETLADGFNYVDASHSAGSFVYILHGLEVHRDPANLRAVTT
jgi:hypothetical protein